MNTRRIHIIKIFIFLPLFITSACGLRPYDVLIPRLETLQAERMSQTPSPIPPSAKPVTPTSTATLTPSPSHSPSPTYTQTRLVTSCATQETITFLTLINHVPYTLYVTLKDACGNEYGFPLAAAFTRKVEIPSGDYTYRILVQDVQEVRGSKLFDPGISTWEFYDTGTILDSPTPLFTSVP